MEKLLVENLGSILTILSVAVGFGIHYGKLKTRINELEHEFEMFAEDLRSIKEGGLPTLCRLHEDRLTRMEDEIRDHAQSTSEDIREIKRLVQVNHDLIENIQRKD